MAERKTKKRANGEGSFSKRNGRIEYRVVVGTDQLTGKLIRKSFYGKTQGECKDKYKAYQKGLEEQKIAPQNTTLSAWIAKWLEVYKKDSVSPGSYVDYLSNSKLITSDCKLGTMLLTEIKPLDIAEFYQRITGYSLSVHKKIHLILNAAFETAIDNDLCYKNPVKKVKPPKKKAPERKAFSDGDIAAIYHFSLSDSFGLPIVLLLLSGMRRGELLALRWTDIDMDEEIIHIRRAIKADGSEGEPKSEKSKRDIPIIPELKSILGAFKKDIGYVLSNDGGSRFTISQFRTQYDHFFERLNDYLNSEGKGPVEKLTTHSTRHTFGTKLYREGTNAKDIQLLMGHEEIETTGKYIHGDVEHLKAAISKLKVAD